MKALRIYSDQGLVPKGVHHSLMMYPFWGNAGDGEDRYPGRLDDYVKAGRTLFRLTDLSEADVAVLPFHWEEVDRHPGLRAIADTFFRRCHQAGKPVLVFYISDNNDPLRLENAIVFRISLYRSSNAPFEFPLPTWSEDFARAHLHSPAWPRPKGAKPVVSFCGHAEHPDPPLLMRTKKMISRAAQHAGLIKKRTNPWIELRGRAVKILMRHPDVACRFLVRERHFGGAVEGPQKVNQKRLRQVRRQFVANMLNSDYVLCIRGGGNTSFRFYEALSAGKIPVFVNTDSAFPFEEQIPWRDHVVWVELDEIELLAEKLLDFHHGLSHEAFVDLQRKNRHLWEEWLSPLGFFRHLQLSLPSVLRTKDD